MTFIISIQAQLLIVNRDSEKHLNKFKDIEYSIFDSFESSLTNKNNNTQLENAFLSNVSKKNFWRSQKWIALGVFVGAAGVGTFFNSQAGSFLDDSDAYYKDYNSATTTQSAVSFYNKAVDSAKKSDDYYNYRDITFSVSLVPLGYFFYAWYMESKY